MGTSKVSKQDANKGLQSIEQRVTHSGESKDGLFGKSISQVTPAWKDKTV